MPSLKALLKSVASEELARLARLICTMEGEKTYYHCDQGCVACVERTMLTWKMRTKIFDRVMNNEEKLKTLQKELMVIDMKIRSAVAAMRMPGGVQHASLINLAALVKEEKAMLVRVKRADGLLHRCRTQFFRSVKNDEDAVETEKVCAINKLLSQQV